MKKILSISILLFLFACEDSELVLDGTYKLSEAYMDCDGDTEIVYTTIDGLTVTRWDYNGDDCDDGNDCYYTDVFPATKDGDALKVDMGHGGALVITRNGTNGLKITWLNPSENGEGSYEIFDYEADGTRTYSPTCN